MVAFNFGSVNFLLSQPLCCTCNVSGNGCGHTVLGTESGTLASQNYPGTYPSNTWCKWRLRVPEGRTLRLLFGDFDIESSPGCSNGSLVITDKNGKSSLGKLVHSWWNTVCVFFLNWLKQKCSSSCLLGWFFIEIPADRLFMICVITDVLLAMIVDAIPLTHWQKRQTLFRNRHMHIFIPGVSNRV